MSRHDHLAGQIASFQRVNEAAKQARRRAKEARQRERKEKAQKESAAVLAQVWEDRPGKARPTDERRAKGDFRLVDGEDAGVTFAVDQGATIFDQLQAKGMITPEQCQGGVDMMALLHRTRLVSGGRSCLDMTPVSTGDGGNDHAAERDEEERKEIYLACGTLTWAELRRCCDGHDPRSMERLRAGLDICAKFWG